MPIFLSPRYTTLGIHKTRLNASRLSKPFGQLRCDVVKIIF